MNTHDKILGIWELRFAEPVPPMTTLNPVQMQFDAGGDLIWATQQRGEWNVLLMSYRTEGTSLHTRPRHEPGEEVTGGLAFGADGRLQLELHGVTCHFERVAAALFPAPCA